jgi:hypothetical protein
MIGQRSTHSAALIMLTGLVLSPYCGRRAYAQSPFQDTGGPPEVRVQAGPAGTRIAIPINRAPAEGDSIHVVTNTSRIRAVLIMPDGRRIGEARAQSSGFQWTQVPNQKPLGSNDGGYQIEITFTKPAAAGVYAIQFTSASAERGALAQTWFTSRMQQFEKFVQSLPGAQIAKPVLLSSGATAKVEVKTAMQTAFLDVVVPSDSIEVTLTLPSGRIVRRDDAKAIGIEWNVENDSNGQGLGLLRGIVLPLKGNHHMIGLPNATPGTYMIGAKAPAGTTGELRAALLPFDEAAKSLGQEMFGPSHAGVTMQLSSPLSDHFVGDQVELTVRLNGALDAKPPEFVVRVETQPYLPSVPSAQGGGRRLGPAGAVMTVPAMFHKDSDGTYRGAIPLREAGWTRVAVRAKGTKAGGEPFEVEEVTSIPTDEIVARVAEMQAQGKNENGDGKFQSLEVALAVDVMVPGSYMFATYVSNAAKEAIHPIVTTKQLAKGRQSVTAVVPSGQIWNQIRSGPLNVEASLTLVMNGTYVPVPGKESLRRQVEYRREDWDSGAYKSQDVATVHGIRPAGSGRFTIAEVEWDASTPGGQCAWSGQLTDGKRQHTLFDRHYQAVPPESRKFSFFFDGAAIAAAGTRDWVFEANVACGDRKNGAKLPAAPLDLNSEDYQTSQGALEFDGDVALSQRAPGSQYWGTDLMGLAAKGNGADSAHFEITKVPEGWKANVYPIWQSPSTNPANLFVEPAPDAGPGRYFLQVTAVVGEQRVTREFIVELFEQVRH